MSVTATGVGRVSFEAKLRDADGGKPKVKIKGGASHHDASGTWHEIDQVVDRANNRYRKVVRDADGNVLRDVDVPLDEHQGHGDDHTQPKAHP